MEHCNRHDIDYNGSDCPRCIAEDRHQEVLDTMYEDSRESHYRRANPGDYECPHCKYITLKQGASRCPTCQGEIGSVYWDAIKAQKEAIAEKRRAEEEEERVRKIRQQEAAAQAKAVRQEAIAAEWSWKTASLEVMHFHNVEKYILSGIEKYSRDMRYSDRVKNCAVLLDENKGNMSRESNELFTKLYGDILNLNQEIYLKFKIEIDSYINHELLKIDELSKSRIKYVARKRSSDIRYKYISQVFRSLFSLDFLYGLGGGLCLALFSLIPLAIFRPAPPIDWIVLAVAFLVMPTGIFYFGIDKLNGEFGPIEYVFEKEMKKIETETEQLRFELYDRFSKNIVKK